LPAWVFLGYWFLIQFVATSVEAGRTVAHQTGGVAFAAHVGGFVAGLLLVKVFPRRARSYRYGTWGENSCQLSVASDQLRHLGCAPNSTSDNWQLRTGHYN